MLLLIGVMTFEFLPLGCTWKCLFWFNSFVQIVLTGRKFIKKIITHDIITQHNKMLRISEKSATIIVKNQNLGCCRIFSTAHISQPVQVNQSVFISGVMEWYLFVLFFFFLEWRECMGNSKTISIDTWTGCIANDDTFFARR